LLGEQALNRRISSKQYRIILYFLCVNVQRKTNVECQQQNLNSIKTCRFECNMQLKRKTKRLINYVFGPLLFAWLAYAIYRQIQHQPNLSVSWTTIRATLHQAASWKIYLVILLMFCHWGIEARKWQILIQHIEPCSFLNSCRAVLVGLAFTFITPNRTGEFIGRMLYVHEGHRLRAIAIVIVGAMSQLFVTLCLGLIGVYVLKQDIVKHTMGVESSPLSLFWFYALMYAFCIIVIILFLLYFKLSWLVRLVEKIPVARKHVYIVEALDQFRAPELLRILSLSFGRYIIFIVQYILLLQIFKVDIAIWQTIWILCVFFFTLAIVPSFAVIDELGIRGKASIVLLGIYSANTLGILATAGGIWLINLFVPALVGSLFILTKKLFKRKSENI